MGDSRKFVFVVLIAATMAIGIFSINNFQYVEAGLFDSDATVDKTCSPIEQFEPGTIRWDIDVTNTSQDEINLTYICTGTYPGDSISGDVSQGDTDSTFFEVTGLPAGEYPNTITCEFADPAGITFDIVGTSESCFVVTLITFGSVRGGGEVLAPANASDDFTEDFVVEHGFSLHCDVLSGPNRLSIEWGDNSFHLSELERSTCTDDGSVNEPPPSRDTRNHGPGPTLDVYSGFGFGRVNGECGGFAEWVFDDNGEPGNSDHIVSLEIRDKDGNLVLDIDNLLTLTEGNHQWVPHPTGKHGPTQTSPCEEVTPQPDDP